MTGYTMTDPEIQNSVVVPQQKIHFFQYITIQHTIKPVIAKQNPQK